MRIISFFFAALLHTVATAHPASDMANQYSKYLEQLHLQALSPADNAAARALTEAFSRVKQAAGVDFPVTFVVVGQQADVFAQSFPGDTIVVNVLLARFSEPVVMFMLAHELGHARKRDLDTALSFYAKHVPANMSAPEQQASAAKLQPRMTALSHGFEFDADAFAAHILIELGFSLKEPMKFLAMLPDSEKDNMSHPASIKRSQRLIGFQ